MKIGIITLPPSFNYGNILQAWALQRTMEKMGHQVDIVIGGPRRLRLPWWRQPLALLKRTYLKYCRGQKNRIIFVEKAEKIMFQHTEAFIQKYLKIHQYCSFSKVKRTDYDAFVVGSDQIWRRRYNRNIQNSYLAFAEGWNVKRISYAASFGTSKWEYSAEETEDCAKLLSQFDGISVREDSGVELVKKYFHLSAIKVLDPTLLVEPEEYVKLILEAKTPQSGGNLFYYLLSYNEETSRKVLHIAKEKRLIPFRAFSRFDEQNAPLNERIQPPVEVWLRGIYDSKIVVTDSFHATVFSIIFKKPFILFDSGIRGNERLASLLKMANFNTDDGIFDKVFTPTEHNLSSIRDYRTRSIDFINSSLKL